MQTLRGLPRIAQIAIPAVVFVLLIAVFMMTRGGPERRVMVAEHQDRQNIAAAQWQLDEAGVKNQLTFNGDTSTYQLKVFKSDEGKANLALGGANAQKRSKTDTSKSCPALKTIPNKSITDERSKCIIKARIHDQLMANPTIQAATVSYDEADDETITGERAMSVGVTLFLRRDKNGQPISKLDGGQLAGMVVASRAGLTPENVQIQTHDGQILWDGKTGGASTGMAGGGGNGCQDSAEITDITTKERLNADCVQSKIVNTIAPIAGGEQYVKVIPFFGLNDTAMTQETVRNSGGTAVGVDNFGGGSNSKQITPNTVKRTDVRGAGSMKELRLSVLLDSKHVKTGQKLAIERALTNYVDDPRNLEVVFADFAGGLAQDADKMNAAGAAGAAGDPTTAATDATTEGGAAASASSATGTAEVPTDVPITGKPAVPTSVLVLGFLLLMALVTTILLLWRRSAHLAKERTAFENEFRSEVGAFSTMANQSPDDVAAQLEAMLGQPSASRAPGQEFSNR